MHLLFYFSCSASVVYDILASEDLFDGNVYLQPPKEGLNSDEVSDSEEDADWQYLSAAILLHKLISK